MASEKRLKMRIIQVTPRFPPAIGGVEEHVFRVSKELAKRGHNVTIITSNEADGRRVAAQNEQILGMRIHRNSLFMPSIFRESWLIPKITPLLRKLNADVVHAHGYRCLSSFQAVTVARFRHTSTILTPHGIYQKRSLVNGLMKSAFDKSVGRLMFSFCDRIITLSSHNEHLLSQLGVPAKKMITVPNGIDLEEFANLHRETGTMMGLNTNGPVLLYVGRIDWNKQVDKIIEAMPMILRTFPSAKLAIVGPDYANYTRKLDALGKKLGLENSVIITHDVPRRKLLQYYSIADAFVLPSSYEGFGLSMLEAMGCGVPVIVSPAGGPGDILKNKVNALFLKEVSPSEIAEQVCQVLTDNSLRLKITGNARQLIKENYTWKKVVDQLERVYLRAIRERESA